MDRLSDLEFELLRTETDTLLFRCTSEPILLLVSRYDSGSAASRFTNELAIGRLLLDVPGVASARELCVWRGNDALIIGDPGGQFIPASTEQAADISAFLEDSIKIASALSAIHSRGIVHGDIRPGNILIHGEAATIIGLGCATAANATVRGPNDEGVIPERLPYLSPDGSSLSMALDRRSDLYSLGVTFYQNLTGHLPLSGSTPLSWAHAHAARPPIPVGRWMPFVPATVAAILMKLIAKAPEDRYQTAEGLTLDLRRALEQAGSKAPASFVLGTGDARDHLSPSRRIYGRQREIETLKQSLAAVRRDGRSKIVLISGYSGVGKTRLVDVFRHEIGTEAFLFAAGKFDQISRGIPFATLTEALGGALRRILASGEEERESWKNEVAEAVGRNGRLITDLIPEVQTLLGPQPDVPQVSPSESQARFQLILMRLIQVFADKGKTLVLFLDDLQWIDPATFDLLQRVGEKEQLRNVLLIGAYRDSEVAMSSPLQRLASISKNISLGPLDTDDVVRLVADSLGTTAAAVEELANAVCLRTAGNPFFTSQLLSNLVDDNVVFFDCNDRSWHWDLEQISKSGPGIVDLMTGKISRLSAETRHKLALFAFLGNQVSARVLSEVFGVTTGELDEHLVEAVLAGLIFKREDGYSFLHDRVQEAAYGLVAFNDAPAQHLELGRRLVETSSPETLADGVFDIVGQYNRGVILITDPDELYALARLNFLAGNKAEGAAAYGNAFRFYSIASSLFSAQDPIRFDCELRSAHCEWLNGLPEAAEMRLTALYDEAGSSERRGSVAASLINIYIAIGDFARAVKTCVAYMHEQNVIWSPQPSWEAVKEEFDQLGAEIEFGSISERVNFPTLEHDLTLVVLDVLAAVLPAAFFTDKNFVCLVLCKMANLSREHGNGPASALGYAYLGMVLGPVFGDYKSGYAYGRAGLRLVQKPGFERYKGRVSMTFAYHVQSFNEPLHASRTLLGKALEVARESGDLTYSGFSSCTMVSNLLLSGEPLSSVARRAEEALQMMGEIGFGLISDIVTSQLQLTRCLQGQTAASDTFSDGSFDEAKFEARLGSTPALAVANCWHHIRKLQAFVHFGDFTSASKAVAVVEPLLWTTEGHLECVEFHFYASLTKLRNGEAREDIGPHLDYLAAIAASCPFNFVPLHSLVNAEVARQEGAQVEALRFYDRALSTSAAGGFVQVEALAAACLASALAEFEMPSFSSASIKRSRDCYRSWGASRRVAVIEAEHPHLRRSLVRQETSALMSADVETVVRSHAAVASESVPARMLDTLMTIALEHAGAQRGMLLLPRSGEYIVEAEATAGPDGIDVSLPRKRPRAGDPVETMLKAALVTGDVVLSAEKSHGSAMVIPLISRGKTMGLLFLENRLSDEAFSPVRIALVKLVAAQAAISVENASLEEKESLLKEVHHRVKNNLQLISSLLNLQASKIDDPAVAELFADSRNRVRSMALVHENLYRAGDFANVSMASHISNLTSQLSRVYGAGQRQISVDVRSEEISLELDQAISCGLILNELVSNALKHAFNGERRGGEVRVQLFRPAGDQATLSVIDNGQGLEDSDKRSESMGMQLVRDLTDQLHGTLEILVKGGTEINVTFPTRSRED